MRNSDGRATSKLGERNLRRKLGRTHALYVRACLRIHVCMVRVCMYRTLVSAVNQHCLYVIGRPCGKTYKLLSASVSAVNQHGLYVIGRPCGKTCKLLSKHAVSYSFRCCIQQKTLNSRRMFYRFYLLNYVLNMHRSCSNTDSRRKRRTIN